jgi:hypothetical protein
MKFLHTLIIAALSFPPVLSAIAQTPATDGRDAPTPADTETVRHFRVQSARLTAFWGRPIFIEAGVVLPPARAGRGPAGLLPHQRLQRPAAPRTEPTTDLASEPAGPLTEPAPA